MPPTLGYVGGRSAPRMVKTPRSRSNTGRGRSGKGPRKLPPNRLPRPPVLPPGPPVPVPLPPAPLMGPATLLSVGAMVLAGALWGALNSLSKMLTGEPDIPETDVTWDYRKGPATKWEVKGRSYSVHGWGGWSPWFTPAFWSDSVDGPFIPIDWLYAAPRDVKVLSVVPQEHGSTPNQYGTALTLKLQVTSNVHPPKVWLWVLDYGFKHEIIIRPKPDEDDYVETDPGWSASPGPVVVPAGAFLKAVNDNPAAVGSDPDVPPGPSPEPPAPDDAEPTNNDGTSGEPAPAPGDSSTGAPAPVAVPTLVGAAAGAGGALLSSGVRRMLRSGGQPLDNAGQVPPPQASKATTTSTTAHVINGKPVEGGSASTNPAQMAQELQRIERKLERMMGRPAADGGGEWFDDLADSLSLIKSLWDALTLDQPEGSWRIEAPCDKTPEGAPVEVSYQFPAADYLAAIMARLEALAEMQADTIGWRRRTCRGQTPTNNVTITAYEIMPE